MKKINSIVFFIIGIVSIILVIVFFMSFVPSQTNRLVNGNLKYGDLYQMAKITDFKSQLPSSLPQKQLSSIQNADIIIMGDSFFNVSAGYKIFAEQIAHKLDKKVHNYNIQGSGELWRKTNPLDYLKEANFKYDDKKRILILESVDRGLMLRYGNIKKSTQLKVEEGNDFTNNDINPPKGAIEMIKLSDDHLRLEGWGADDEYGSPLKKIEVLIDSRKTGLAITGYKRPDIESYFKNEKWSESGWSYDQDLNLTLGRHIVSVIFYDNNGNRTISDSKPIYIKNQFIGKTKKFLQKIDVNIKNKLKSLDYLTSENFISISAMEFANTIRFKLFKIISPLTPKYSLNPKMLFYKEEVEHFNKHYSDEDVEKIANYIEYLATQLENKYNIELIFVPMPNKYVIYSKKTGELKQENFLSRLYKILDKKNVKYVNLLEPFKESSHDYLYYFTDTHLNNEGMKIVVKIILYSLKN